MEKEKIIEKMSNRDKAYYVQGTEFMYTNKHSNLDLRQLSMSDGPHGVRKQIHKGDNGITNSIPATAFPTESTIAQSWEPELAYQMGSAIGEECRYFGVNVLLGPGVNIKRNPLCGRNFEYYSEDPLLAGILGASCVEGIQSQGVSACIKHFAANNQEDYRYTGNSVIDEKALREIYLKPFEYIVKHTDVGALMTSYNKVNGTYASENAHLLSDILRKEWGYDGVVMSDWGGTNDRIKGLIAGEDLEMPGDNIFTANLVYEALEKRELSVDDSIRRIIELIEKTDYERIENPNFDSHHELSLKIALSSAVLLKNDGTLPLAKKEKVCIVGGLFEKTRFQGSGSSTINPIKQTHHKMSFEKNGIEYDFAKGYLSSTNKIKKKYEDEAIELAKKYDTIVLYLGLTDLSESESIDREHMKLPQNQISLLEKIILLNKKIVIVLFGGSAIELPHINKVNSILYMGLPGQNGGETTTKLLFGDANPCGKLAQTWPISYSDVPYGGEFHNNANLLYKESIFVGYRYYSTVGREVLFPFGFGLSYTEYSYSNFELAKDKEKISIALDIKNIGEYEGSDILQLYVSKKESNTLRAKIELKSFLKVFLKKGESKRVNITLDIQSLSVYDVNQNRNVIENGEYTIYVGKSCNDFIYEEDVFIDGEEIQRNYSEDIVKAYYNPANITNELFGKMANVPNVDKSEAKLFTLETRLSEYNNKFFGRVFLFIGDVYAMYRHIQAYVRYRGVERENALKGAMFIKRVFVTNSAKTLSMSAAKSLSMKTAQALVHLLNGHVKQFFEEIKKKYKIKKSR